MSEKLSKYTKPRLFSIHLFAVEKVSLTFLEVRQFFNWRESIEKIVFGGKKTTYR